MIFLGDIHGKFNIISEFIIKYDITNNNIIQVGDFGIGFHPTEFILLNELNTLLLNNNVFLYVIRGNHDDPFYFSPPCNNYTNIIFIQDWTYLTIENKTILFIGGAISIDRNHRTLNLNYWLNENITPIPNDFIYKPCDIIVSHDCPLIAYPYIDKNLSFFKNNESLYNDCYNQRIVLNNVWENIKPNKWIYGHYHKSNKVRVDNTDFILLNINEFYEII